MATVNVTVNVQNPTISREGFGTPLILTAHTRFAELYRVFSDVSDMIAPTGPFQAGDLAVTLATALKAQNPTVGNFLVGRRTTLPTRSVDITPVAQDTTEYTVTVEGQTASFTSGALATVAQITAGLKTAIDALSITNLSTTDNSTSLTIANTLSGSPFTIEVADRSLITIEDTTLAGVASDIPGDLAAIQAVSGGDDWYAVTGDWFGEAETLEAAAYIETQNKLMVVALQDDDILTSSTTDAASNIVANQYNRTILMYDNDPHNGLAAAFLGRCLSQDAGTLTWKFKSLAGVDAPFVTTGEIAQLEAKSVNYLRTEKGATFTANGVVAGGANTFIDVTRTVDALTARLEEDLIADLLANEKIPFTDSGINVLRNRALSVLNFFVAQGALAADPAPTVTFPRANAVSTVDRANRLLPNGAFTAQLAGAVHNVNLVGTITP